MKIKGLVDFDLVNYHKNCLTIEMPICKGFKCGGEFCQNSSLAKAPTIDVRDETIIDFYLHKTPAAALCFQGLEPFDSFDDMICFISKFRNDFLIKDDIVIYTGYNKDEISTELVELQQFENIIIKFGRYIPHHEPHFDKVLGVKLASDNQYAERIS